MPLTDTQTETLARNLLTIARCARQLHADIEPKRPTVGDDGAWHRPTYGPKPPCNVHIVSILDEAGRLLGWYLGRIAADFITTPLPDHATPPGRWAATRDATTHDKANRLYEQRGFAAATEWATEFLDDMTHLAQKLTDAAEPQAPAADTLDPGLLDRMVSAADAARVLGIPVGTIYRWGSQGAVSRHARGGKTLYRLGDLCEKSR